jgi:hypothetical protein
VRGRVEVPTNGNVVLVVAEDSDPEAASVAREARATLVVAEYHRSWHDTGDSKAFFTTLHGGPACHSRGIQTTRP